MNGKPRGIVRSRLPQAAEPVMTTVASGGVVAGFVLRRGRDGFEAFDRNGRSRGKFPDLQAAAAAVRARKEQAP
jgi:hypothetical protein